MQGKYDCYKRGVIKEAAGGAPYRHLEAINSLNANHKFCQLTLM